MSSQQSGSVIRAGSRVSALVGELGCWNGDPQVDRNGKGKKRFFGTVAESKSDTNWLVRWDQIGAAGEEECLTFKLKHEGPESDLRPTNQEATAAARQEQQQAQQAAAPPVAMAQQARTAPPQQTTTTTTAQQPGQAAAPPVETAVEEVEENTAQAAAEDANARTVDPDVLEEQDDRFDVANDFELCNPDDIAEHNGDRYAKKWQHHQPKKAALIDEELSVGTGLRKITWKVTFDIKASDVDPAEFPDVGVCNFDFATPSNTTKTTASGWENPKKNKKHRKQKKEGINFLVLLIRLWPGKGEDQLERMNNRVEARNQEQIQKNSKFRAPATQEGS
jgi:hypothetical protein